MTAMALGSSPATPVARLRQALFEAAGLLGLFATFSFPLLAFALSVALLLNLPAHTAAVHRRLLTLVAIVSVCLLISSRAITTEGSDDLIGYYDLYLEFHSGDLERFAQFGSGLELVPTSLLWLWATVLPTLTPNGLMLCLASTSALLFWFWLETTFFKRGDENSRGDMALIGVALLLFNLYFSTQLARQFLSLVVLLYAFTARTPLRRALFVTLAASCHLTALPVYAAYLLVRRGKSGVLLLLAGALLLRLYFGQVLSMLDVLPQALIEKLVYYVDNTSEYSESDLGALKLVGLLCAVSLAAAVGSGFRQARGWPRLNLDPATRPWHVAPWATLIVFIVLLPIPLASLRTTLLFHSIAAGVIAFHCFGRKQRPLLVALFNVFLINKLASLAVLPLDGPLTTTFAVLANAFE